MSYRVYCYTADSEIIFEMTGLFGEAWLQRDREGYDLYGSYSLGTFSSLEDAEKIYPDARIDFLC